MSMQTLGKLTIVSGGTPQQFTTVMTNCKHVLIETVLGNANDIFIGNKNLVKATLAGCFRVIPAPSATTGPTTVLPFWDVYSNYAGPFDLSTWYLDGTTGESILVAFVA